MADPAEEAKSTGSGGTGGTGGTGGFLRDLMSTLDNEESSQQESSHQDSSRQDSSRQDSRWNCKDNSEEEDFFMNTTLKTDEFPMCTPETSNNIVPEINLPPINDQRQTMFSPTPKDMVVHLPHINLKKLNKAWNNSIDSGGASLTKQNHSGGKSPKMPFQTRSSVDEQIVEGNEPKRKKGNKKGAEFNSESNSMAASKRQSRDLVRRQSTTKKTDRSGSIEEDGGARRQHGQRRESSASSHGSYGRTHQSKQAKLTKLETYDSGSEDSDNDGQKTSRKISKKGRKNKNKKAVWRGWDTGRLAPHKLRKLPEFADLAPQIGDWINNYVMKQPNFEVQTVPLDRRESDNYVRDYLAVKGINEIFELMTQALLVKRPANPLDFLIEFSSVMTCQLADTMGRTPCCTEHKVPLGGATLPFRAANTGCISVPSVTEVVISTPETSPPESSITWHLAEGRNP